MTIYERFPLGRSPWATLDPFLFVAYHADAYPEGTGALGPEPEELRDRPIGQDFDHPSGWNMYHGEVVPGFPAHPHRGFETVTYVRRGLCDHADSLGAAARFGKGDTQWITTGDGIVHSEMFPLVRTDAPNPLELFQIWLNLPAASKAVPAHFSIFWHEETPRIVRVAESGARAEVVVLAGAFDEAAPLAPPPSSWAARDDADVAIWHLELEEGASITLPPAADGTLRTLYFFEGGEARLGAEALRAGEGARVDASAPHELVATSGKASFLVLQGRPIGEPVARYGPFVLNDEGGVRKAFVDYQRTRFGGWPWPSEAPTHGSRGRFARYPDGTVEEREAPAA